MKVLTEIDLRTKIKDIGSITTYKVPSGTILTPAARSFLSDNKIQIVFTKDDEKELETVKGNAGQSGDSPVCPPPRKPRYLLLGTGVRIDEKPEAFTHLHGNNLVPKYHPRIQLRGKVDALEAHIIVAQITAGKNKMEQIAKNLEEVLTLARNILRAEVLSEPLPEFTLFGLSEQDIREISHNPKKTLGVAHFIPSSDMGEMMAQLNLVRTQVRQTELAAVEAFYDPTEGLKREDIIKALNRMSSAVYVMMCRLLAGKYDIRGFKP